MESGKKEPPRNSATPHGTMDNGKKGITGRRGTWRNPAEHDGTPRITNRRPLRPQIHLCVAVFPLLPLSFPLPPFPDTRRFGGFETIGVGWRAKYMSDGKGQWAQWTTAEPHGTWRDPTEHQQEGLTPSNSPIFLCFRASDSLVFSFPHPFPHNQRFGGFETPGSGWRVEYRGEEKGHRE